MIHLFVCNALYLQWLLYFPNANTYTEIAQQPTAILARATGEGFQLHTVQRLKYLSFLKEKVWHQMAA